MSTFLRGLPERIWWVTLVLTGFAIITQLGLAYARSATTSTGTLLTEFVLTLVFLALPVWIAWRARQDGSLWYACGALVLFVTMAKIFFF